MRLRRQQGELYVRHSARKYRGRPRIPLRARPRNRAASKATVALQLLQRKIYIAAIFGLTYYDYAECAPI